MTPEQYILTHEPPKPAHIPRGYLAAVARYEAELDLLHANWRAPNVKARDFSGPEFDACRGRIKWLLKRRSLLQQGRDWRVTLAWRGTDPFAHPVEPTDAEIREGAAQPGTWGERGEVPVTPWSAREIDEQSDRNAAERGGR